MCRERSSLLSTLDFEPFGTYLCAENVVPYCFHLFLSHFILSTIFSYDLKQLVTLVTTGDSQKYIYIGGKYGRQLNVIEF